MLLAQKHRTKTKKAYPLKLALALASAQQYAKYGQSSNDIWTNRFDGNSANDIDHSAQANSGATGYISPEYENAQAKQNAAQAMLYGAKLFHVVTMDDGGHAHNFYTINGRIAKWYNTPHNSKNNNDEITIHVWGDATEVDQGGREYQNQHEGDPSTSLLSFRDHYSGMPLNQIAIGESSFLFYKFPNYVDREYRFVNISNGRQVDMTHFLVVGPRGHFMGIGNEVKQIISNPGSAFYPQDLYSNRLGVNFFNSYGSLLQKIQIIFRHTFIGFCQIQVI